MGTISTTPAVGTVTDDVRVTFVTPGEKKTSAKGNTYTAAIVTVEGVSTPVRLMGFGHLEWAQGTSQQLKLKEADADRSGMRSFQVDAPRTGGGGRGWGGGAPARPTWDMSGGDAAKYALAVWKHLYTAIATDKPEMTPDTVGIIAQGLAVEVIKAANIAVTKPAEGAAA